MKGGSVKNLDFSQNGCIGIKVAGPMKKSKKCCLLLYKLLGAKLVLSPGFNLIKLPPKIPRKGRPKGAEKTAIGLPICNAKKKLKPQLFVAKSSRDQTNGNFTFI